MSETTVSPPLTRRAFLKQGGLLAALVSFGAMFYSSEAVAAGGAVADDEAWGMLIDLSRCTGCDACARACKQVNDRPFPEVAPDGLSNNAYTYVESRQVPAGSTAMQFIKHQCMHCLHPACVSACTVGALRKSAEGPVTYDAKKCFGCRYCQYACPFGVPTYDWNNPLGMIHKCEMCFERLQAGEQPACVAACPAGALQFGRRKDLLAQARARIRTNPERYVKRIYGEVEAGGTSVLYLSSVPFRDLGFPELGSQPIPLYAEAVMNKTPVVALSAAAVASGLHFAMRGRKQDASDSHTDADGSDGSHDFEEENS